MQYEFKYTSKSAVCYTLDYTERLRNHYSTFKVNQVGKLDGKKKVVYTCSRKPSSYKLYYNVSPLF